MTISRLPGRIVAVMVGTVAVMVVTVAVSVFWMTRAMDDQARTHAAERVRNALGNVLSQMRATTLDYAKWNEAAARLAKGDTAWLDDNIGSAAVVGETAQLIVVWGGGLVDDIGWTDDSGPERRTGVLDPAIVALAEAGLAGVPLGVYQGVTFFAWRDGAVFALAAARIEAVDAADGPALDDAGIGRIIMGRRLDEGMVRAIGEGVQIDGIEIARAAPADRPSLPLMSGDARPVAHLAWDPHLAGTALLRRMLPALALFTALAAGLALAGMTLVRRGARHLAMAEHRSSTAARTDPLTGLPNRAAFNAMLAPPASAGERAILFLDVNGFKRVNDSIGHAAGDEVIVQLAGRLGTLRDTDCSLARIGGDEFVFVLTGANAGFRAKWLAHAVERAMAPPFDLRGQRVRLGAALGYAVQADDQARGDALVHQADLAMYEAKRHRDRGPVAYGALIGQADHDAQAIERALREALAQQGQLSIAYQPITDVGTGRLVRAEALARWTAPGLGSVPPDRFIAVAEQSGLIIELGRRLLGLVCDDLGRHPDLCVGLNVSPLQLLAPAFVPDLLDELAHRGIKPSRIEIELTERVIVDDPRLAARCLSELHAAGFSTALDDFGTGYSSIAYLEQMEFDVLKIDRSFVSGFGASSERLAVLNAMILLAHALRLRVVCEGIESGEELDLLRDLGCDLAQGYHIDRPMPIEALAARWLAPDLARVAFG